MSVHCMFLDSAAGASQQLTDCEHMAGLKKEKHFGFQTEMGNRSPLLVPPQVRLQAVLVCIQVAQTVCVGL